MIKQLIIVVFLECMLYITYRQIRIKSTQLDVYKLKALSHIYFRLGNYRKEKNSWKRKNEKYCKGNDLRGIHHPDTVLEDLYMANKYRPYEYQDYYSKTHALYANEYTSKKSGHIKRIKWNMIIHDPYKSKTLPCIFDKQFCNQLTPDPHQKSTMTFIQNKLIAKLTANNASQACLTEASLSNKEECLKVMNILNKKEYMRGELPLGYLLKSNAHLQKGVRFLKEPVVQEVLRYYGNGTKCGVVKKNLILQEFISNPVLWKKRAFTIRIFLLFVSAKPWITYIYQESVLHVCIQPWSTHELSPYRQLCNGDFSHQFFQTPEHKRPKLEDVGTMDIVKPCPTHIDFANMLLQQGHIKSLRWLETDFYPKIAKKITHMLHHGTSSLDDPRLSQLFGIDFELDTDGNFWILDFNTYPSYYAQTVERRLYMKRFFDNTLGLLKMYMKQKYLRIKKLIETVLVPYLRKHGASSKLPAEIYRQIDIALTDTYLPDEVINNYKKVDLRQGSAVCKEYYK